MRRYLEITLTPNVLAAQHEAYGAARPPGSYEDEPLGPAEAAFVEERDSFYMATVGETGWPYVQHRGGPAGFLKVVDPFTLAFADLRGNRQLISTGNLAANDRVSLFLMDYPGRRRLKIIGRATVVDVSEDPELAARVTPEGAEKKVERVHRIRVVGFDWNCPQQITPRFSQAEVEEYVASLKARIGELEAATDA